MSTARGSLSFTSGNAVFARKKRGSVCSRLRTLPSVSLCFLLFLRRKALFTLRIFTWLWSIEGRTDMKNKTKTERPSHQFADGNENQRTVYRQFKGSFSPLDRSYSKLMIRILFIVQELDRSHKSCRWRNVHDKMADCKRASHLLERHGKAQSTWQTDASRSVHGSYDFFKKKKMRAERMVRRLDHRGLRRPRELVPSSHIHVKRFKHQEGAKRKAVVSMCRRISQTL